MIGGVLQRWDNDRFAGIAELKLHVANFLLLVAGILFIVFGSLCMDFGYMIDICICEIVLGVALVVTPLLGCFGSSKPTSCIYMTYMFLLLLLIVAQLILAIFAFLLLRKYGDDIRVHEEIIEPIYMKSDDDIDALQRNFECCGHTGVLDPEVVLEEENCSDTIYLIDSCCSEIVDECDVLHAYKDNCTSRFRKYLLKILKIAAGFALGFNVIQLVALISACYLRSETLQEMEDMIAERNMAPLGVDRTERRY